MSQTAQKRARSTNSQTQSADQKQKCILVPGGAGYIGSHVVVELLQQTDYTVIVIDNLSNATPDGQNPSALPPSLNRVLQICTNDENNNKRLLFFYKEYDDLETLDRINEKYDIVSTIIVAGFKAVGESKQFPLMYYKNNVCKTVNMLEKLDQLGKKHVIFSSSATVYNTQSDDAIHALTEKDKTGECTCAYARTKSFIEEIMKDLCNADKQWKAVSLRYFNPVGAHPSGLIGEDPHGIPNNLMPFIAQVAVGRREKLSVFGSDYKTRDGTGVRDYLHVVDLAQAHVDAVKFLDSENKQEESQGFTAINLGSGTGSTVLEMISAFEKAAGKKIAWQFTDRRPGDVTALYCDPKMARDLLNWETKRTVDDMCADTWRFQSENPFGYSTENKE